jgi:hypothetical protein
VELTGILNVDGDQTAYLESIAPVGLSDEEKSIFMKQYDDTDLDNEFDLDAYSR